MPREHNKNIRMRSEFIIINDVDVKNEMFLRSVIIISQIRSTFYAYKNINLSIAYFGFDRADKISEKKK